MSSISHRQWNAWEMKRFLIVCFVQLSIYLQLLYSIFIKVAYLFLEKPNSSRLDISRNTNKTSSGASSNTIRWFQTSSTENSFVRIRFVFKVIVLDERKNCGLRNKEVIGSSIKQFNQLQIKERWENLSTELRRSSQISSLCTSSQNNWNRHFFNSIQMRHGTILNKTLFLHLDTCYSIFDSRLHGSLLRLGR